MLYISAFTFGGGFVIVTFMKKKFVDKLHWLSETEMLDITALAQSCPGAIAVNAAILTGIHVAGPLGAAAAVLGTVIPPVAIISVISLFYKAFAANMYVALVLKGMQAGVAAVLADVVLSLGKTALKKDRILNGIIMAAAFCLAFFTGINIIFIVIGAIAAGLIISAVSLKKEGGAAE